MPLEIVEMGAKRAWGIWRITESEQYLSAQVFEDIPADITNETKRLEWITGRVLTQTLLATFKCDFHGITKDEYGKPFLRDSGMRMSLSHSFPYVAAILDTDNEVGIDLEQPKQKLLRVASRVLSESELRDGGDDIVKHCVYWCSKETLIKIHGKKDLTLATNLQIEPFDLRQEGTIIGRIIVAGDEKLIPLQYRHFQNFVVVFNQ